MREFVVYAVFFLAAGIPFETHAVRTCSTAIVTSTATVGNSGALTPRVDFRRATPHSIQAFIDDVIYYLLDEGGRREYATVSIDEKASAVTVTSPEGAYTYWLTKDPEAIYPVDGMPEIQLNPGHVSSQATLLAGSDLERSINTVRASWGADQYLCSTQQPPDRKGLPAHTNYYQRDLIEQLLDMENWEKAYAHFKRAIVAPVAGGKTLLAAVFVREWHLRQVALRKAHPDKPPKVIFVIEDAVVLRDAIATFKTEMGFSNFGRVYDSLYNGILRLEHELIAITRSSFSNRIDQVENLIKADPDQNWVIIFDEGHHAGKTGGQFEDIKNSLDRVLTDKHRLLFLSATLWHQDSELITKDLKGFVAVPFLDDKQLALLRSGKSLVELCRASHMIGIQKGYFPGIDDLRLIRNTQSEIDRRYFTVHGIEQSLREKDEKVYRWLMDTLYESIVISRIQGRPDRSLIFVPSKLHADVYAELLQRILREKGDHTSKVVAFHGDLKKIPRRNFLKAFLSEEDCHMYFFVVDMLGEGANTKTANHLAFMSMYGDTANSFRESEQNWGRGGRWSFRKPGLRATDFVGFSDFIFDGLGSISVERLIRRPSKGKGFRSPVFVNGVPVEASEIEVDHHTRFPTSRNFFLRFEFYDDETFRNGALKTLAREAPQFGVDTVTTKEDLYKLFTAFLARIPKCKEKALVAKKVEGIKQWPKSHLASAFAGREQALRSVYEIYHSIVSLQQLYPSGADLKDDEIHKEPGCYAFLKSISSEFIDPLTDYDKKVTFVDKITGALGALQDASNRIGQTNFERNFGARDYCVRLAQSKRLYRVKGRKANLERIASNEIWLWTGDDARLTYELKREHVGQGARPIHREPFQRIYRALRVLAEMANAADPDLKINVDKIHERGECERLIAFLDPEAAKPAIDTEELTVEQLAIFMKSGLTPFIKSVPQFGVVSLAANGGLRESIAGWADQLAQSPKATRQHKISLGKLAALWRSDDSPFDLTSGSRVRASQTVATEIYTALHEIGLIAKEMYPESDFKMEDLYTESGVEALRDVVQVGFVIPPLTSEQAQNWFVKNNPVVALLKDISPRFEVSPFVRNDGLRRFAEAVGNQLREKDVPAIALDAISSSVLWQWKPGDGSTAATGENAAMTRVYRFLYVLYHEWNVTHPEGPQLDLSKTTELETLHAFVDLVTFGFVLPELTEEAIDRFRDSRQGAYGAMLEYAPAFRISSVTASYPSYWTKVARRIPLKDKPEIAKKRDALVKALLHRHIWGWSESDTMQMVGEEYFESSSRKMFRAMMAIAVLWNEAYPNDAFDLHDLHGITEGKHFFQTFGALED